MCWLTLLANVLSTSIVRRSTSSRTVSVGASPRTGTLNSRDLHHSQLMNMSSGSQLISSSPPPVMNVTNRPQVIGSSPAPMTSRPKAISSSPPPVLLSSLAESPSHRHRHAAVRPVFTSPIYDQSSPSSPHELSLVSPMVTVNSASPDLHSHYVAYPAAGSANMIHVKPNTYTAQHLICACTSSQSPPLLSPSITSLAIQSNSSLSQILSSIVFLVPCGLPSRIFDLHRTKWALVFVCFSFFFFIFLPARLS